MVTRESATEEVVRAVQVLEYFWGAVGEGFDRTVATSTMTESVRAIPGDARVLWLQRLVSAGEAMQLRLRTTEATLEEAIEFWRHGRPIATRVSFPDGREEWIGIVNVRGSKVLVRSLADGDERWYGRRQLLRLFGLRKKSQSISWIIGQAALPCDMASDTDHHHGTHHISPFARLLHLMRPEKTDLWIVVLFSVVVGVLSLATPITVEALVNTVAFGQYLQPVIVLSAILLIFLGFAAAIRATIAWIVELLQRRLFVRVVEDLAYRLPRVEAEAFDEEYGPELVNRFFDVATLQKVAAALLLEVTVIILQTFIGMAVLAFYHPFLLGFDAILLGLIVFITFVLGRGAVRTAIEESKAKYRMAAWLQELVRNPTAFKFDGGQVFGVDRADKLAADYVEARRIHFRIVMRQIVFALGLQAVAATTLLGLGGWLVIQGELTLGQLVAAELIVMMIVGSFAKMGKHLESFYDLLAGVDKLGHLFDLPVERQDKLFHLAQGTPASVVANHIAAEVGGREVFHRLSFQIKPGESLAFSGPAGSGKSILADLLCGLRRPHSGYVLLDGVDMRELRTDSLREHVALCRDIDIFEGTIDENIRLNRPHLNIQDVRNALQAVGMSSEILNLTDGVRTQLRTLGRPLSASQAARLMIARAIVGRPRLLVIDGLLDRLGDQESIRLLQQLLVQPRPWSVLLITNRRDLAALCDRTCNLRQTGSTGESSENLPANYSRFNESEGDDDVNDN
jgi:ABC-type bacteriocin/lantibiotic exporter with double-glycine peptidase domain